MPPPICWPAAERFPAWVVDGNGNPANLAAVSCIGSGFDGIDVTYDGEGHRTTLVENPASGASANTYLVTWNGHGDALALWRVEADGTTTLANSYTYDTWGRPTTATHNGIADLGFRFLYVGEFDVQWDDSFGLGLLYMHARHYSPSLGRFLQPDPDGSEANLYAYAANSPVTELDPDGTCFILCVILVPVLFFAAVEATSEVAYYAITTPGDDWSGDGARDAALGGAASGALSELVPGVGGRVVGRFLPRILSKVPQALRAVRGGESAAAANGRYMHRLLENRVSQKPGWSGETRRLGADGRWYKPDVVTPKGRVLEYKPNTPSGRRAGRRQIETYRTQLGVRGRVIYYRPQ